MSYNFGGGRKPESDRVRRQRISRRRFTERNARTGVKHTIIRLDCINRYSRFKYRRSSESRGGVGTGSRGKAEERSKRREVESTRDCQSHGNRKGWTEKGKQG